MAPWTLRAKFGGSLSQIEPNDRKKLQIRMNQDIAERNWMANEIVQPVEDDVDPDIYK